MSVSDVLVTIKNIVAVVLRVVEFTDKVVSFVIQNVKGV